MKTYLSIFIFTLFLGLSGAISEYTLSIFKHSPNPMPKNLELSFFYGWVECNGDKQFFIQENYQKLLPMKASITNLVPSPTKIALEKALGELCEHYHLISFRQTQSYPNSSDLKLAKVKMSQDKKAVLKLFLDLSRKVSS